MRALLSLHIFNRTLLTVNFMLLIEVAHESD